MSSSEVMPSDFVFGPATNLSILVQVTEVKWGIDFLTRTHPQSTSV